MRPALRVVISDDNAERRRVLLFTLRSVGADVVDVSEADGAATTLEIAEASGADAVVLEIQLPGATRLIASLRRRNPELAIIVCSFQADAVTRSRALEAGADSYLVKPIGGRELYGEILGAHERTARPPDHSSVDLELLAWSDGPQDGEHR
jgi:DNA-binding response OmpR family regulator